MSRDEVPAEVRALAEEQVTSAWRVMHLDRGCFTASQVEQVVIAAIMATLAPRPAAPATDAEGEQPLFYISRGQLDCITDRPDESGQYLPIRKATAGQFSFPVFARSAPAPQAVEEQIWTYSRNGYTVRTKSREIAMRVASKGHRVNPCLFPADRQRARAGQDGGA